MSETREQKLVRPEINLAAVYGIDEAATVVGVSMSTIARAVRSGRLKHCRIGRRILLRGDQIVDFLRQSEVDQAA